MTKSGTEGSTGALVDESVSSPEELHVSTEASSLLATPTESDVQADVVVSPSINSGITTAGPSEVLRKQGTEGFIGVLPRPSASSPEDLRLAQVTESPPSLLPTVIEDDTQADVLQSPSVDSGPAPTIPADVLPGQHAVLAGQQAPLDHQWFPHIIDTIIETAPRESLLKLSLTSKSMWRRISLRVPTHIRLTVSYIITLPPEVDTASAFADQVYLHRVLCKGGSDFSTAFDWPLSTSFLQTFAATRVLDLTQFCDFEEFRALCDALAEVHTVRCNQHISCPSLSAKRLILDDTVYDDHPIHRVTPLDSGACPEGVEKIVHNIRYSRAVNMGDPHVGRPFMEPPNTVREIVVIFTHIDLLDTRLLSSTDFDFEVSAHNTDSSTTSTTSIDCSPVDTSTTTSSQLGWLGLVLGEAYYFSDIKYTFVDAHLLPPISFGLECPLSTSELKDVIIDRLAIVCRKEGMSWDPEHWEPRKQDINFVDRSTYRREIGDMDYNLETEFAWPEY